MPMTELLETGFDESDLGSVETENTGHSGFPGSFSPGRQTTLRQRVHCFGIGLHTGRQVRLALAPADPGTGIVFRRTDLEGDEALIPARWDSVVDTTLCTVIGNRHGTTVGTVEHLMAALCACGVDNAVVELDAPEPPAMDLSLIHI